VVISSCGVAQSGASREAALDLWLLVNCTGSSHSIACFEVRGDFRFGLVFSFFSFGEPYETFSRVAHCELAKLSL